MQNCRDVKNVVGAAIKSLKDSVRWRRGKDTVHLRKHKLLGHLPVEATLDVYNGLIRELMDQPQSKVYGRGMARRSMAGNIHDGRYHGDGLPTR